MRTISLLDSVPYLTALLLRRRRRLCAAPPSAPLALCLPRGLQVRRRAAREWLQRPDVDITERHRTVIALEPNGISGRLRDLQRSHRRSPPLDVLVDQLAVVQNSQKLGIRDLLTRRIEARGLEPVVKGLPLRSEERRVGKEGRS